MPSLCCFRCPATSAASDAQPPLLLQMPSRLCCFRCPATSAAPDAQPPLLLQMPSRPSMLELQSSTPLPPGPSLSPTLPLVTALSSPSVAPLPTKRTRKWGWELELLRQEDVEMDLSFSLFTARLCCPSHPCELLHLGGHPLCCHQC
jgi:hypothetical protein